MRRETKYTPSPLVEKNNWRPKNAVWELTLACNLRCGHCGSRAGKALPDEMATAECLDAVRQLHELGCELITLSGGEPTLREDWDIIARAIAVRGIYVNMVTNGIYGKGRTAGDVARRALAAGMCNVGVSIDGPREVHERIRGAGTFDKTAASVKAFREAGLSTTVMTTVNRLNIGKLSEIRDVALSLGARALRFQLAKPMGTMDEHRDIVLAPDAIHALLPELARMKQAGGIDIRIGDSLGYYGRPDKILRGWSWRRKQTRWGGCQAGLMAIGIQANGDIKGCLSLQATRGEVDPFVEGNLRETALRDIWHRPGSFSYNRNFQLSSLKGDCRDCKKASLCRGGARCVSTAVDGTTDHDDYCYYRFESIKGQASWSTATKTAAAAAALALAVNVSHCGDDSDDKRGPDAGGDAGQDTASEQDRDTTVSSGTDTDDAMVPDYAVEPQDTGTGNTSDTYTGKGVDTAVLEYGVTPDYAVEPIDTRGIEPMPDYGVELDYGVMIPEPIDTDRQEPILDYGVEPD